MIQRIYNCEKTRDFIHEWARYRLAASKSPGMEIVEPWDPDAIERIQKWSDENPERPKITIEERNFLEAFKNEGLLIARYGSGLRLTYGGSWADLRGTMFSFIHINQPWTIGNLLMLEVDVPDTDVGKKEVKE